MWDNVLNGINWGKRCPTGENFLEHNNKGKTVGLLLRMTKTMIGKGKAVIPLDSGFCVLKALIELRKIGIFASPVVKKRRYYPNKFIKGEDITEVFCDKPIVAADAIGGIGGTLDG
jgi:Transposase IS4